MAIIPKTLEEYLTAYPEHVTQRARACLHKMGYSLERNVEDLSQHIRLMLLKRSTVEKFDISKRNAEGNVLSERNELGLFFNYMNVCIWRHATLWAYSEGLGYVKSTLGKDGKLSNTDALAFVDDYPVTEDGVGLFGPSLIAAALSRFRKTQRRGEDSAIIARLRHKLQAARPCRPSRAHPKSVRW
jgi:hypothetical protein